MSILADAWMTGIGPYGTSLDVQDFSELLAIVINDTPGLISLIKTGEDCENINPEWIEDAPNAFKFTGAAATSGTINISSPTTTAAMQGIVRNYSIIGPEDGSWLVQVNSDLSGPTLLTTAYGNTTFATAAAGTTFIVWNETWGDKDDVSDDISQSRNRRLNYTQVFEKGIQIQQTRKGIKMKAVPDELKHQLKLRTMEIKRKLHQAIFGSHAYYSSGFTGDFQYRTMAGLFWFMRDYDLDATNEDTMVTNASSNAITLARINAGAYNIYNEGGFDEGSKYVICCGPTQARKIAKFDEEFKRTTASERTAGFYKTEILTDMGEALPLVVDRYCQNDCVYILDMNRIKLRFLSGDHLHVEKMAKTGRSEKWQLSMQATLEIRNADTCHYLIRGLSTT